MTKYTPVENHYIQLDIAFATAYGVNEALIFGKLHRLEKEWQGFIDEKGVKWIRLTYDEWESELPFLSRNTIIRTLERMTDELSLLYSTVFKGRSKWYRCNSEFVSTQNGYLPKVGKPSTQNGLLPNSLPNSSKSSSFQEEDADQQKSSKAQNPKTPKPITEEKANQEVPPAPAAPEEPSPAPVIKPKTIIKDKFIELTGRKMPKTKSSQGFWWSQFGEILHAANDNYERACTALEEVVPYMREHKLPISSPKSVVGLCGDVLSGQKLNGNGATKTNIAPGQEEMWSNLF